MAERTPKKVVSNREFKSCRCCGKGILQSNQPVCLFGVKSETEGILRLVRKFSEVDIFADDGLPKYICRSCVVKAQNLQKKLDEFKVMCKEADKKFKDEERVKRCRKNADSPTGASPLPKQAAKKTRQSSLARISLQLDFANTAEQDPHFIPEEAQRAKSTFVTIAPKPVELSSTTTPSTPIEKTIAGKRVLPQLFRPPKRPEINQRDDGSAILSNVGLHNKEVGL